MIWLRLSIFAVAALVAMAPAATAQSQGQEIASRLPVEVAEVVIGGTWVDGNASGYYRVVTIQNTVPAELAEVCLQWVGSRTPAEPLQILSSVPLREFNALKLASASLTLEVEGESVVRVIVAGQDSEARPADVLTFRASKPGLYAVIPPEAVAGTAR